MSRAIAATFSGEAAVALVLAPGVQSGGGIELLLIKRAEQPGDPWSGQVALPGGRWEEEDQDLLAGAEKDRLLLSIPRPDADSGLLLGQPVVETFLDGEWVSDEITVGVEGLSDERDQVGELLAGRTPNAGCLQGLVSLLDCIEGVLGALHVVAPQRVDHGAAHAALGEGLELDAARFVEAVRRVNQPDDAVLHQIADVNGVRHGRRHAAGELFHEGDAVDDARIRFAAVGAHVG